jgi:uncharacterized protein (DUF362 family)
MRGLELRQDPRVAIAGIFPTVLVGVGKTEITRAVQRLGEILDWGNSDRGPFGKIIPKGARVLIKPNWVTHANQGPWGIEPLLTDAMLVRAVVEGALQADPAQLLVGDAPIQACDFDHLLRVTGLQAWAGDLAITQPGFKGIRDFRRTTCVVRDGIRFASEEVLPLDRFVLFDLASESLLEPVTDDHRSFRVTQYDPEAMAKTHGPGRHQYLVARDVMEADVVVNLPKLKTHKKAGREPGVPGSPLTPGSWKTMARSRGV